MEQRRYEVTDKQILIIMTAIITSLFWVTIMAIINIFNETQPNNQSTSSTRIIQNYVNSYSNVNSINKNNISIEEVNSSSIRKPANEIADYYIQKNKEEIASKKIAKYAYNEYAYLYENFEELGYLVESEVLSENETRLPADDIAVENIEEAEALRSSADDTAVTYINEDENEGVDTSKENTEVVNKDDIALLAHIMYAEEGSFIAKYYDKYPEKVERVFKLCGSCILNRKEYSLNGEHSIEDVLYAENQYPATTKSRVAMYQEDPTLIPELVYVWAEELLRDGVIGPEGLVYQSQQQLGKHYDTIWNQVFGTIDI